MFFMPLLNNYTMVKHDIWPIAFGSAILHLFNIWACSIETNQIVDKLTIIIAVNNMKFNNFL